jgi:hypothetical protein
MTESCGQMERPDGRDPELEQVRGWKVKTDVYRCDHHDRCCAVICRDVLYCDVLCCDLLCCGPLCGALHGVADILFQYHHGIVSSTVNHGTVYPSTAITQKLVQKLVQKPDSKPDSKHGVCCAVTVLLCCCSRAVCVVIMIVMMIIMIPGSALAPALSSYLLCSLITSI